MGTNTNSQGHEC